MYSCRSCSLIRKMYLPHASNRKKEEKEGEEEDAKKDDG